GAGINSEATMSRLQELENEIEEEAARLRELFPSLRTTVRVELGDPVEALAEGSASAQLTVVGTRGHGRVVSTLLGSVSRGVLLRAEGAVMGAPTPRDRAHRPPGCAPPVTVGRRVSAGPSG